MTYNCIFFFFLGPHLQEIPTLGGQIGAGAAGLHHSHSNTRSQTHPQPTLQLQEHQILNPLNEARDQTHILMDASWVLNPLNHKGNSRTNQF